MPLTGTLGDLSLANLVQLQCSEQNRAQVRLSRRGAEGILIFADGELIYASAGVKTGDDAVYELLTWEDGEFRVDNENADVPRNIETPWSALLLEGLRRADEVRAERDAALESALRELRGKQGLRAALVVNGSGSIRADTQMERADQAAALIALLAGRAETIGALLNLGALGEISAINPNEKVWIKKTGDNYWGCWVEGRTTLNALRALMAALNAKA